jgi:hypothetical protein
VIDQETAEAGLAALSVAIASILEDAHESAVAKPDGLEPYSQAAFELGVAGADVAMLAAAMKILVRRAESAQ